VELSRTLVQDGVAELVGTASEAQQFTEALRRLASEPVESEVLLIYPRLTGIRRDGNEIRAAIELPEAFQ
jgi:hypothetical protein